jgi:hypothetical protein
MIFDIKPKEATIEAAAKETTEATSLPQGRRDWLIKKISIARRMATKRNQ